MSKKECKHEDIRTRNEKRTRFQCNDCGKWFSDKNVPNHSWELPKIKNIPKVLLFDTENAPNVATVWRVWQENIAPIQLQSDWYMLSWSAKWLNDSQMMGDVLTPKESIKEDDKRIVRSIHNLLDEADIVIAHNAPFDLGIVNTRFLLNGMTPPRPFEVIDTLRVARKNFAFAHNKLDFLADRLKIPHKKLETSHQLWLDCRAGKEEALAFMLKYNKMDVTVLEELYMKIRAWIKPHPNFNLFSDKKNCCSTCGSENIKENGKYSTTVNLYKSFRCDDCGSFSRSGISNKKTDLRSVAR